MGNSLNLSFGIDPSCLLARFTAAKSLLKKSQVLNTLILDGSLLRDLPFEMELQNISTLTCLSLSRKFDRNTSTLELAPGGLRKI